VALTAAEERKIRWAAEMVRMRQESEERGTTAKDFREMKKRNEKKPETPPPPGRIRATAERVVEWMEAHPSNRREAVPRARKRKAATRRSPGGFGPDMDMRDFIPSSAGFGAAMGYEPLPHQGPRKTKRSTKRSKSSGESWSDPGYIPPELKWMF